MKTLANTPLLHCSAAVRMRIAPTFNVALRALRRNKMRSVLTALGIIIGVGAVIAMVGIGNGAKAQVAAGNQNWFTRIYGESADYFDIRQWPLADGAPFTSQDVRSANKVCVIGRTTATQIYGNENPIGQILRIKEVPFTITGVLMPKGLSTQGVDQDDIVIMPYTSAMKRVIGGTTLRNINVQIADPQQLEAAQKQIVSLLRQRHNIRQGRDDDFTVRNQEEIAQAATATTAVMTVLLGSIAGVSLVVGGIGIMNIMLVSVTERTREIGTRMAVGAHGSDILMQFLIEAVTLSSV